MGVQRDKTTLERAGMQEEKPVITMRRLSADFRDRMAKGLVQHMEKADPERVFADILRDIPKKREELMKALLGVSESWGKVEMDHCNGRMGPLDAETRQKFADIIGPVVDEEIRKAFKNVQENTKHPIRVAIRNHIRAQLHGYEMEKHIGRAMEQFCRTIVDTEIEQLRRDMLEGEDETASESAAGVEPHNIA